MKNFRLAAFSRAVSLSAILIMGATAIVFAVVLNASITSKSYSLGVCDLLSGQARNLCRQAQREAERQKRETERQSNQETQRREPATQPTPQPTDTKRTPSRGDLQRAREAAAPPPPGSYRARKQAQLEREARAVPESCPEDYILNNDRPLNTSFERLCREIWQRRKLADYATFRMEAFEKACNEGDLASCYQRALSLDTDTWQSLKEDKTYVRGLYQKVCDSRGAGFACVRVARMFELGNGVPRDMVRADKLYVQACEDGNSHACYWTKNVNRRLFGEGAPPITVDTATLAAMSDNVDLYLLGQGKEMVKGTFELQSVIPFTSTESDSSNRYYLVSVRAKQLWDKSVVSDIFTLRQRGALDYCVSRARYIDHENCELSYPSREIAIAYGKIEMRQYLGEKERALAKKAAEDRRETGNELNQADKACLKEVTETTSRREAQVTDSARDEQFKTVYDSQLFIKNVCNRRIEFITSCLGVSYGKTSIAPGGREPLGTNACYRVYP